MINNMERKKWKILNLKKAMYRELHYWKVPPQGLAPYPSVRLKQKSYCPRLPKLPKKLGIDSEFDFCFSLTLPTSHPRSSRS